MDSRIHNISAGDLLYLLVRELILFFFLHSEPFLPICKFQIVIFSMAADRFCCSRSECHLLADVHASRIHLPLLSFAQ